VPFRAELSTAIGTRALRIDPVSDRRKIMPALNPLLRYKRALVALKQVNSQFAAEVQAKTHSLQDGMRISLGSAFANWKTDKDRDNLRAYLLCLCAFHKDQIDNAKKYFLAAPAADIIDSIKSFSPNPAESMTTAVHAKLQIGRQFKAAEVFQYGRKLIRDGKTFVGGNCYQGAIWWLYLGGVVSLRWVSKYGTMSAEPGKEPVPEPYFNWSQAITDLDQADKIPEGRIVFLHRGIGGVHYVLTTGQGLCIALNNPDDVVVRWKGPPPFPEKNNSQFSLAGLMKTCILLDPRSDEKQNNYLKHAVWKPTNAC
jgi:hypothetical protein